MSKPADITGNKYGRLTAIKKISGFIWLFNCECGQSEPRNRRHVQKSHGEGSLPSCKKCFSITSASNGRKNKTHGLSIGKTRKLYDVHRQMMQRCYNPSCKDFINYGNRGISVCSDWHSNKSFIEWALSSGYRDGLTIERVDVNGNYAPENCTWIFNERQAKNTRKVKLITAFGKSLCAMDWSEKTGISPHTIKTRIRLGWNPEIALTKTPVIGKNQFS